jgi:hypothetical protein
MKKILIIAVLLVAALSTHSGYATGKVDGGLPGPDIFPNFGVHTPYFIDEDTSYISLFDANQAHRSELIWAYVETSDNVYNWGYIEPLMASLRSQGSPIVFVIAGCPAWANPTECQGTRGDYGPWSQPVADKLAEFMAVFVARYRDDVTYYEILNEPDQAWPNVNDWAYLQRVVYQAVHQDPANSDIVIMNGGLARGSTDQVYTNWLTNSVPTLNLYTDLVAIHWYPKWQYGTPYNTPLERFDDMELVLGNANVHDKKYVFTEVGANDSYGCPGKLSATPCYRQKQANVLTQYFAQINSKPDKILGGIWFSGPDWPYGPGHDNDGVLADLGNHVWATKPSYDALVWFSDQTKGAFVREMGPADGLTTNMKGYLFSRAAPWIGGSWGVVWYSPPTGTGSSNLTLTDNQPYRGLTSIKNNVGAPYPYTCGANHSVNVTVGESPIFVGYQNGNPAIHLCP